MKYRTRMVLAYATIALLVSLGLGLMMYRTSLQYEQRSQKNNLLMSARSCVSQMDTRLGSMNAIMYYILSDASMLESITLLGRASDGKVPRSYTRNAETTIQVGISTDYIMKNSYRTVFFNQGGFLASSAVASDHQEYSNNQRLIDSFRLEEISYLPSVTEAGGRSVIVTGHTDPWGAFTGGAAVYSMMKALQGYKMGFLEVQNRLDSLSELELSDPDTGCVILVNDNELLYENGSWTQENDAEDPAVILERIPQGDVLTQKGITYACASSAEFPLTVLTCRKAALFSGGKRNIFLTSVLAALIMFSVSLAAVFIWSAVLTKPVRQLQQMVEETNIENLQDIRHLGSAESGLDEFKELTKSYRTMTERLDQALRNEKRSAMLQLQAQFDTLQTQVNPHFIYNVLNIISSRAVMADDEVICEMCGSLGNMLRYSTNNRQRHAKVEEELEYLRNYFYLLKCRYESRLQVTISIDEATSGQVIPKMTLQQIVENAVKHGFHDTDVHMEITLVGKMEKNRWTILVRDNGVGMSEEKLSEIRQKLQTVRMDYHDLEVPTETEIGGMGLTNTYARCLLLFGNDLIFELRNREDAAGFEVVIGQYLE
ncbi:MAG: histidine kinase [Lachnospiraceae bacterium]|nr:histidine kinase [Lachnospiraceae bacterium]